MIKVATDIDLVSHKKALNSSIRIVSLFLHILGVKCFGRKYPFSIVDFN